MKYIYKAYNKIIQSDIVFPELEEASGKPDVIIKHGKHPKKLKGTIDVNPTYVTTSKELLWHVDNIGIFYVHKKGKIICDIKKGVETKYYRNFILGMCFSSLMISDGVLPIHCSAFEINNLAVLAVGLSGSGKSSLSSYVYQKSHKMLTDDILGIRKEDSKFYSVSSYPMIRIKEDTAVAYGLETKNLKTMFTTMEIEKYLLPMGEKYSDLPYVIGGIFEIEPDQNVSDVMCTQINGVNKIDMLRNHIFGNKLIHAYGMDGYYFEMMMEIAQQVPFYTIKRPVGVMSVDQQYDLIKKVLQNLNYS